MEFSWKVGIWVLTAILAVIPIWALQILNSLWLRPKRLERLLRAQGLHGDPYTLSHHSSNHTHMQHQEPFALSNHVAPLLSSSLYHTLSKYGKNCFFWEGTIPKVIITDLEQIKDVFNNIHDFQKPKLSGNVKFLVSGLISYEDEKWAKHRRIINPAFHLEKLKNMLPAFSQSCHDMISAWSEMLSSDGTGEIDVWPFLQNLSRDVISRTAFGSSYAEGTKIFELLKMQGYLSMKERHKAIPILQHLPSSVNKKMRKIEREMCDSIEGIIKKREEVMKNGEIANDDLLSKLLESNHNEIQGRGNLRNAGMTKREVVEECKLFYMAGQETTSSLLVWTMVLLGRFPEWQARAREEVLQVFGNQSPNFDGLGRLKIVTMIFYEVLRLYPPTYFVRSLQKDMNLGYLSLPAGVRVSIPILCIHQDRDIWGDDAKEFNPERFSEGIAKATKGKVSYFPFGWGPRVCVGQNFALLEAKMVLSLLLQNFSFVLSPSYTHAPTALLSFQPKHGAQIIFHKL
ncbi:11-oxo-beta-amyrin 30-oxidase-like [Abrus precatorius]|uniref:11-oxo-beta-amyrin 30-oxidase-like n=1 Tax=Abrus precatorius TaxID=3816 RepID=A0A8B8LGR4_ABRPR|nr:11-oxo-beta-amyrin 30-oxidase-like [Abrus precatorius]